MPTKPEDGGGILDHHQLHSTGHRAEACPLQERKQQMQDCVYIIHFDEHLSHARHYTGSSANLPARIDSHARGFAARLTTVIRELGIGWTLAAVYVRKPTCQLTIRKLERQVKNQKNIRRFCPLCAGGNLIQPKGLCLTLFEEFYCENERIEP